MMMLGFPHVPCWHFQDVDMDRNMTFPDWPLSALHARLVPLIKLPLLGLFAAVCICCCIIHISAAV